MERERERERKRERVREWEREKEGERERERKKREREREKREQQIINKIEIDTHLFVECNISTKAPKIAPYSMPSLHFTGANLMHLLIHVISYIYRGVLLLVTWKEYFCSKIW